MVAITCVLFESRRLVHSTNKPGPRPPRRTQMMTAHCVRIASVARPRAEHLRLSQAMLDSPPIPQLTNHPSLYCSQRTYAKSASSNAITRSPVWAAIRVSRVPPRQRKNARRASVESHTGLRCLESKTEAVHGYPPCALDLSSVFKRTPGHEFVLHARIYILYGA